MNKILIVASVALLAACTFKTTKSNTMEQTTSEVTVWDTYVTKKAGAVMHFDILAPIAITDTAQIYKYGKEYLETKGQGGQLLSAKQCRRCHVENMRPLWQKDIDEKGYYIIEMEGCD